MNTLEPNQRARPEEAGGIGRLEDSEPIIWGPVWQDIAAGVGFPHRFGGRAPLQAL